MLIGLAQAFDVLRIGEFPMVPLCVHFTPSLLNFGKFFINRDNILTNMLLHSSRTKNDELDSPQITVKRKYINKGERNQLVCNALHCIWCGFIT